MGKIAISEDYRKVEVAVFARRAPGARSEGNDFHGVCGVDDAQERGPDLLFGYGPGSVSGLWHGSGHRGLCGQYSTLVGGFERSGEAE
jgi:hypothetical protein